MIRSKMNLDGFPVFKANQCPTCNANDDNWCLYQFLSDGAWRKFDKTRSLREQGIEDTDDPEYLRLYVFHGCVDTPVRELTSTTEINSFMMTLREV